MDFSLYNFSSSFYCFFIHSLDFVDDIQRATKPEEITAFLEIGFEYIMNKDDLAYFRKRK